ncbi:hypothetical protein A2U01_0063601, partial [Trifolium medium]|nr:hypothetical protein [Trifolium medium]
EVACVYCGGGHLFADCHGNPISVNYVANYNKNNNPYNVTYNSVGRIIQISLGLPHKINRKHLLCRLALLLREIVNWRQF